MNGVELLDLIIENNKKILSLYCDKSHEYGQVNDRLAMFKYHWLSSKDYNPKLALWQFLEKHLNSIYEYCNDIAKFDYNKLEEKVNDAILYLILLLALKIEEIEV